MHPFALSRADDAAKAIAAHAIDPQLAFIAGGTDLLGLIKDRAAHPERLLDINGLPDMGRVEALPGGGPKRAPAFSRDCRGVAVRGVGPAPQHGLDGRQHHAADSLSLLPRR